MGKFLRLWGPPLLYTALIFGISAIPFGKPPLVWRWQDKGIHFVEYGILAALLFRAFRARYGLGVTFFLSLLTTSMLGAADECLQSFIPTRTGDWIDGLADFTGALAGSTVMAVFAGKEPACTGEEPPGEPD
ncbi:MAG: VanZ family protein [Planctomycetota bacterium]|jgi:VanZ family protein